MKRKVNIIVNASAASVMAFAALAQDPPASTPDRASYSHEQMAHTRDHRLIGAAKASEIIGMPVKNNQDEKLGKVEDLALDVESGRVVYVILSTGGFLGIGDTLTAVPPGALHQDFAQKTLQLDANKAKLQGAPKFDNSKWDEDTQTQRVTEVYSYYDEHPYFLANRDGSPAASEDEKIVNNLPRHLDGTANTIAPSSVETTRNEEAVRNVENGQITNSYRNADGTLGRSYTATEKGMNSWPAGLGYVQKASKLMGMDVKNLQNQKLGDVENLMVDLSAGRIVAVIISSGGFLGMGEELSAVPPTALRCSPDRESLQLDTTKEMLSNAPHFKADQWPDFGQASYVTGMYRAYHVQPYFNNADNGQRHYRSQNENRADNSAPNVRDRDDQTLTPLDQGDTKADIALTAKIRKEITNTRNLSVDAQNVKIITRNGQVTLRGPVNTAAEKKRIGEIAKRFASAGMVDNQLQVQANTSSN